MRQQGLVSILGILLILALVLLGVGSYFRIQDQKALEPSPTPAPIQVMVDKTHYDEGVVLVSFKTGTTVEQAGQILSVFGLEATTSANLSAGQTLSPTNIYKVTVSPGAEQSVIQNLLTNSQVSAATLSYK